jgi:hypothetical protein
MPPLDPKRVIGNRVHARARHVLGKRSARNRFCRLLKESFVSGTVQGVVS